MSGDSQRSAASKRRKSTKNASNPARTARRPVEGHVCPEAACGKVCATPAGLASHRRAAHPPAAVVVKESPTVAVERLLASIEITPKLAVLAATIRELAQALELCEPGDKAKTSKELTARVAELLADPSHRPDEPDWTEDEDA